jgi:hypothetical protein
MLILEVIVRIWMAVGIWIIGCLFGIIWLMFFGFMLILRVIKAAARLSWEEFLSLNEKEIAMKRVFQLTIILAALSLVTPAFAVDTWYKTLSGTVAWDALTTYEDGSPIEAAGDGVVTYNVYMKNVTTGVQTKIGSTPATSLAIVIPTRGKYRLGIQAELSATEQSPIGWSDDPVVCSSAGTFGFRLLFPAGPKGFKKQ